MRYRALFPVLALGGLLLGLLAPRPWAAVDEAEAASGTVWKCYGFDAGKGVRAAVWVHNDADKNPIAIKVRFLSAGGTTVAEPNPIGIDTDQTVGYAAVGDTDSELAKIQSAKITTNGKYILVDAERIAVSDPAFGADHFERRQVSCSKSRGEPDPLGVGGRGG